MLKNVSTLGSYRYYGAKISSVKSVSQKQQTHYMSLKRPLSPYTHLLDRLKWKDPILFLQKPIMDWKKRNEKSFQLESHHYKCRYIFFVTFPLIIITTTHFYLLNQTYHHFIAMFCVGVRVL